MRGSRRWPMASPDPAYPAADARLLAEHRGTRNTPASSPILMAELWPSVNVELEPL